MKRKEKRDMRKKGIAILLAICMGLLAIPASSFAYSAQQLSTPTNLKWKLTGGKAVATWSTGASAGSEMWCVAFLYKNGKSISTLAEGYAKKGTNQCDFTDLIEEHGTGLYSFRVQAIADPEGVWWGDSAVSGHSQLYKYTAKKSGSKAKAVKKPKRVTNVKVKKGKRKMTVRWKRDRKAAGYQITYARNKKFTKGKKNVTITRNKTTRKTISRLKKRTTYYVKVRAYNKSGKTKAYGSYSVVKKVKVR
ncbi:fibronectin type III domain-containing protein [Zhenpiania hominis]|mgnify:FL=1|uniref:Fibronectin type III domain-containing protein n=1 Tax=Zhenpiania hominis TaxID=2763644 RepID=A0A923NR50_9FIRM|nr:fibronectin type III domain-containing protein [Zhenpiania hominis]MBC6681170.1 fibronectin type III domain-containing protein [Zhenpiania hominis]